MRTLSDTTRGRVAARDQAAGLLRATIRTTATSVGDDVYVSIDSQSHTAKRGPCPWMPRGGALPQDGDTAWIDFDETGQPVIVVWTAA